MIKERRLTPGRVIGRCSDHPLAGFKGGYDPHRLYHDKYGDPIAVWIPCMVVSFIPDVKRRHAKKSAARDGWNVLVFWLDDRRDKLTSITITPNHPGWKLMW